MSKGDPFISIGTLDNPGWSIKIYLNDSKNTNRIIADIERSDDDWLFCRIKENVLEGFCGPFNLCELLQQFHQFTQIQLINCNEPINKKPLLEWLMDWYSSNCDGDWEHEFGIKIKTIENLGWDINISLQWTACENKPFNSPNIQRSENNWYKCQVIDNEFQAFCGPSNLIEVLESFRDWVDFPNNENLEFLENEEIE